ncbi:substrate-binding domain-containing protein [Pontibacillus yanchengensis]|uniref:Substrate-binding domain-containing protein n=1 Tax=Pontibacillus yanchengensis TaxID=462910 RepID=A0ACC7VI58_9BACI|nr:LacI family DNA-binding transcriptional regulator [Pontibacillus yanchengensis]MYL53851.1 substrate-binding domain-containing protein [Pontibacillus yanchengensis]
MATIKDVAKTANVSISTVSRVLNNSGYTSQETKDRVYQAVEKLKYQKNMVAAAMINKHTATLGLIIPDIKNIFYGDLTRSVEDTAHKYGYNVILCNTDNDLNKEREYVEFLIQKGVDGIIFSTPEVEDRNIKELVKAKPELPVIVLGSEVSGVKVDEVLVNNFQGAYMATEHLIELGHENIGYISGQPQSYSTSERQQGYESALRDFGIEPKPHYVMKDEFKVESGYQQGKEMLAREDRPTAIFAGNDAIGVGVYQAARELELRIPEDVSVVGFDDSQYAEIVYPTLTTVRTPIVQMGDKAVQLAVQLSEDERNFKETITFEPTLTERNSTRALKENVFRKVN